MIRLNPNEACEQWLVFNAFLYDPVKVKLTKVPRHPTPRASFLRNRTGSSCPGWVRLCFHCCTRQRFLLALIGCCLNHLTIGLFCIGHVLVIAWVTIAGQYEWAHILFICCQYSFSKWPAYNGVSLKVSYALEDSCNEKPICTLLMFNRHCFNAQLTLSSYQGVRSFMVTASTNSAFSGIFPHTWSCFVFFWGRYRFGKGLICNCASTEFCF